MDKIKVVVIGQTPPPYHGQSMMIERLVKASLPRVEIHHVRMNFSQADSQIGQFGFSKITHLAQVVWQGISARFRSGARILYYPPAGPQLTPLLRDIIILLCVRPFYRKTVFHFRAAGLSLTLGERPKIIQLLARLAFGHADGAIELSEHNPRDGAFIGAWKVAVILNGLEDSALPYLPLDRTGRDTVSLLYIGAIKEEKGAWVLIEAFNALHQRGLPVRLTLVGEFRSPEIEAALRGYCKEHDLEGITDFAGSHVGDIKWAYFRQADILCFPTYFSSESFGNVSLEAMMFEMPVVASRWRGIPSVVQDGETGLLVPIKDSAAFADALEKLIRDPELRRSMGIKGRERYLREFSLEKHLDRMEEFLVEIAES
jgi:glycosyltransferase involved in cell wall biosynthesis